MNFTAPFARKGQAPFLRGFKLLDKDLTSLIFAIYRLLIKYSENLHFAANKDMGPEGFFEMA